jgi:hypothetical protein
MAYLTSDDLKTFLDDKELAAIKRDYEKDNTDKLPIGISYAENYVKDRLAHRYNIAAEYAKTGADRSTTLIEVLAHIAIWKLCATFPTVQLDGKRHYNYEKALEDLNTIAKGSLLSTLPALTVETQAGAVVYGQSTETDLIY